METKHTKSPLSVRMDGTCSGAWAEIGQEYVDHGSGELWFRELARTVTTHTERRHANGMPGSINEKPERFELTANGEELIANAHLWAAAPDLLDSLTALLHKIDTPQQAMGLAADIYRARAAIAKAIGQ